MEVKEPGARYLAKPAYKQTEVGLIPDDWEVVSVGCIGTFSSGARISIAMLGPESSDAPVPVYGGNGIAGFTKSALVQNPTVVIGRVGQRCGQVFITSGPSWVTDNALYPRSLHRPMHVPFLARALAAAGLNDLKNRNDLPLVTQSILHAVRIGIPATNAEQEAIAEALSDADALIESLEQLLAKKRQIKQGAMQELLTGHKRLPGFAGEWDYKLIGEFTDCTAGGTPSTRVPAYWGGSIRWMNSGELNLNTVTEVEGRITEEGLRNSSTKLIPANCVLIGLAGQGKTRGTVAINLVSLCTNQSIAAIFPNESFDSRYLYYNLDNRYDELRELSTGDGGRGGLNLTIIRSLVVPYPSVPEQTAIATVLADMDAETAALEARLAKACSLKQGMMQELLTGRIRLV